MFATSATSATRSSGDPSKNRIFVSYCLLSIAVGSLLSTALPVASKPTFMVGNMHTSAPGETAQTKIFLSKTYALLEKNDFHGALEYADFILKKMPDCGRAILFKAYACFKLEQPAEAVKLFKRGLSLVPNQGKDIQIIPDYPPAFTYHYLSAALQDSGRIPEAVEVCTQGIKVFGEYSMFYADRGNFYGQMKQYDKAIADFTKEIKLEHQGGFAYLNRARIYLLQKKPALAVEDLNQALKKGDSMDGSLYGFRASAYKMMGREDLAKRDLELNKKYGNKFFDEF